MITLVFDTCFNKTYIVLRKDDNILENLVIESTEDNYHSVYLIPRIRDILKKHSLLMNNIDYIGINIGPGSFTGIRAGITVARVFAQQANIKLVGINSLHILSKLNVSAKKTIVVTDARKNKVYYAEYNGNTELVSPMLIDKEELLNKITDDYLVVSDYSISKYLKENEVLSLNYESFDNKLGLYLDELVNYTIKTFPSDYHWAKVKPLYIQQPSITKPKEVKNV
ncbi:MAG: tRNA (adenosine(37)-N6)-threonylcarbamoyltransferase complex dimerization subunit type 1 TsaB [Cyanobacteria bacterium SIG29]|nr:tRNA (adenosine(37)-N6)-threonylcarbamoyltransferase complex dimerization subunit type 1 TsaB [Cyanobacteria bacterium SIG29]